MPNWGLSTAARKTRPYGLNPWWLSPGKVITDPVHGDVFLTRLEQFMLDTPPMQRLRRVRQLGTTHLVYPAATHTRFSHSLGAVRVVQTLFDAAYDQRNQNHAVPDLFTEWEELARRDAEEPNQVPDELVAIADEGDNPLWQTIYRRKVAEAIVLARLGALLHDIGHLPFGHTIEDDLNLLTPHDSGESRLRSIWDEVSASWRKQLDEAARQDRSIEVDQLLQNLNPLRSGQLFAELRWLILSSQKSPTGTHLNAADNLSYPFVADLVGNTICADLLDYLERDHLFTGLPLRLGKRYLSSFYITPGRRGGLYRERMALVIAREGRERKDIVTEILKHLRYRYELQERVLVHHTKLAADAMVGKTFELWLEAQEAALRRNERRREELWAEVPPDFRSPEDVADLTIEKLTPASKAGRIARFELEKVLRQHGDDGVLERIASKRHNATARAAAGLAEALLNRDLYKPAANAAGAAAAEDLFKEFGSHEARRRLEEAACEHAEINDPWHVVIWIPDPKMRLKLAELLVDDGRGVAKFKDKSQRGSDIYEAHKQLWTISVFVHPGVTPSQTTAALAKLGQQLGVSWDAHGPELGPDPASAPEHLAAVRALNVPEGEAKVRELVVAVKSKQMAARGTPATQSELDATVAFLAETRGAIPRAPSQD